MGLRPIIVSNFQLFLSSYSSRIRIIIIILLEGGSRPWSWICCRLRIIFSPPNQTSSSCEKYEKHPPTTRCYHHHVSLYRVRSSAEFTKNFLFCINTNNVPLWFPYNIIKERKKKTPHIHTGYFGFIYGLFCVDSYNPNEIHFSSRL